MISINSLMTQLIKKLGISHRARVVVHRRDRGERAERRRGDDHPEGFRGSGQRTGNPEVRNGTHQDQPDKSGSGLLHRITLDLKPTTEMGPLSTFLQFFHKKISKCQKFNWPRLKWVNGLGAHAGLGDGPDAPQD